MPCMQSCATLPTSPCPGLQDPSAGSQERQRQRQLALQGLQATQALAGSLPAAQHAGRQLRSTFSEAALLARAAKQALTQAREQLRSAMPNGRWVDTFHGGTGWCGTGRHLFGGQNG